jgi:hypothetical protein
MEKHIVSIGFSKPKTWKPLSAAIMFAEGTDFSHTFVSWKCTFIDRRKVYEAVGSGSRKISNVRFKEKAEVTDIFQFEVDIETLCKIDQFTHDQAGTPYGYKHILGIGIMRFKNAWYKLIGSKKKAGNPFKDKHYSQICVEAGAYVMKQVGIELPGNVEDYGLKEFYDFCAKYGKKVPQEKIDQINGKKGA